MRATAQAVGITFTSEVPLNHLNTVFDTQGEYKLLASQVSDSLVDIFFKVFLLDYSGPTDPIYIAERNRVIYLMERLKDITNKLVEDANRFTSSSSGLIGLPAIIVDTLTLISDVTGEDTVTASPESFTLRAHIRNLSTTSVSGISTNLTLTSPNDAVTISSPLEVQIENGTLTADDGAVGGSDEADVIWQLQYTGSLTTSVRSFLFVNLLENGEEPSSFDDFGDLAVLQLDLALLDSDLDGLPNDYETANGLDPNRDNFSEDPDGDGLSNGREFRLRTDPKNPDSDGDGLTDGEEATGGEDGFITDPLTSDTDGDEVDDISDGQPLDASTTAVGEIFGEPVVSVSTNQVTLTENQRYAFVNVTNAAAGLIELTWTAGSDNEAIALTSPSVPELRQQGGMLMISVPPSFNFSDTPGAVTTVRVLDVSGATHDVQEIAVVVGNVTAPDQPLNLTLNQPSFSTGDTLVLTSGEVSISTPATVDAYLAIQLPDGSMLFLHEDGNISPDIRPRATGIAPASFTGELFRFPITTPLPTGNYTWLAALAEPGTLSLIGGISRASFSFSP